MPIERLEGTGDPMGQGPADNVQTEQWTGQLNWAGRHPGLGLVLLGTLVVAVRAWGKPYHAPEVERDTASHYVPLFI